MKVHLISKFIIISSLIVKNRWVHVWQECMAASAANVTVLYSRPLHLPTLNKI